MSKLRYGVGVDDCPRSSGGVRCPYRQRWSDMLKRCYSENYQKEKPTYIGCFVCDEWLTLSNFKLWMKQQDWEGKVLDKDILYEGNKEYHPDRCVFVTNNVNQFINSSSKRNGLMLGVTWLPDTNRFLAQVGRCGKGSGYIGLFKTEAAAHQAYLKKKLELANELALKQTDIRVAKALVEMYKIK